MLRCFIEHFAAAVFIRLITLAGNALFLLYQRHHEIFECWILKFDLYLRLKLEKLALHIQVDVLRLQLQILVDDVMSRIVCRSRNHLIIVLVAMLDLSALQLFNFLQNRGRNWYFPRLLLSRTLLSVYCMFYQLGRFPGHQWLVLSYFVHLINN